MVLVDQFGLRMVSLMFGRRPSDDEMVRGAFHDRLLRGVGLAGADRRDHGSCGIRPPAGSRSLPSSSVDFSRRQITRLALTTL
jgi:hypothetical protein